MNTLHNTKWEDINRAVYKLRNEYRIKKDIDYGLCLKYGQLYILTNELYKDSIVSVFKEFILEESTCIVTY